MPAEDLANQRLKKDAEALEEKYGAYAQVYAESRGEAACRAGDDAGQAHWEKVAAEVGQEGDQ